MYENNIENIKKAKNGSEEAMTELIEGNKRAYLEHSKKIYIKRSRNRGFISNSFNGIY